MSSVYKVNFKKHKYYCNRLYKRERKKYYESLKVTLLTIRNFGTLRNHFTDKGTSKKRITLIEDDKIISEVAQTLNNFFDNALSTFEIKGPIEHIIHVNENSDPMDVILRKYSSEYIKYTKGRRKIFLFFS